MNDRHGAELDAIVDILNGCLKISDDETKKQLRELIGGYADRYAANILETASKALGIAEAALANAKRFEAITDATLKREGETLERYAGVRR